MPELPEVENFRRLLLPLKNETQTLTLELAENPTPKKFLSPSEIDSLSGNCYVKDVLRKGKLICMVLECKQKVENQQRVYLYLHMGMTGRVSNPSHTPKLESLRETKEWPPPYSYLTFKTGTAQCAFSDPRKFGSITLSTSLSEFDELAPDALLTDFDESGLAEQSTAIKALLLNQKKVVSGVGNWIADEVLYQSEIHPEQTYLTTDQARLLKQKLKYILETAVKCLDDREEFPSSWLFHCRWGKRKANSGQKVKDPQGRNVTFITAGGRTSAIVPSIQKKRTRTPHRKTMDGKTKVGKKRKVAIDELSKGKEEEMTRRTRRKRS